MNSAELLDLVYESAVNSDVWLKVFAAMRECVQGAESSIATGGSGPVRSIATPAIEALLQDYQNQPHMNSRIARAIAIRSPDFVTDLDFFDQKLMDDDPFYTEFLRPRGFGWCAANLVLPPNENPIFISIERHHAAGPIHGRELAFLNELRPHLARSTMLAAQFALRRARDRLDVFEEIGLPAALVGVDNRIHHANGLFQALVPLVLLDGRSRMMISDQVADRLFLASLERIRSGEIKETRSIAVRSGDGALKHILHILPLRRSARDIFDSSGSVVVLTPIGSNAAPAAHLLDGLFDLTATEAKIVGDIVTGLNIQAIATKRSVSVNTVRTQVKQILAKVGVNRQAELVSLLATPSHLSF